ncbi:MAG: energy transducer TonB [Bacteroidota bacterium]
MNKDMILESDILDIIFENKNKSYGAYNLRKFYNKRLRIAVAGMLLLITLVVAFTFLPSQKEIMTTGYVYIPDIETGTIFKKEPPKITLPPKVKLKIIPPIPTDKFIANIKIVEQIDPADKLPQNLSQNAIGGETVSTGPSDGGVVKKIIGDDPGPPKETIEEVIDINKPLEKVDDEAMFPGGQSALREFLKRNLVNPNEMEEGEEVFVRIKFVVGYDGKLKGFEVMQSGGNDFDKEVIRVLKKMPQWTPGKVKGRNVSVYTMIPIKFVGL